MAWMERYFSGKGAFTEPRVILESLTPAQVTAHPAGAPHSLYEELWHINFWQRWMLAAARAEAPVWPEHAEGGWAKDNDRVDAERWEALVADFLTGMEEAKALAADPEVRNEQAGRGTPEDWLGSIATHNAYHLGRMVFMRQLLGAWPPPSGGDTW